MAYLLDPGRQRDVGAAISNVPASLMEAHDSLHLHAVPFGLLEQLHVGCEVVLLRSLPLADTPPAATPQPSKVNQQSLSTVHHWILNTCLVC